MTKLRDFGSKLEVILRVAVNVSAGIAAIIVFVMMFLITADVILRYVFNRPLHGTYQLAEFMMVGAVYFGVAYVQSHREHINIDVATSWLPPKGQLTLDIFGQLIGIVIFAIITWQTGRVAWHTWRIADYTMGIVQWPLWPAKAVVALGAGLLCIQLIFDFTHDTARLFGPAIDTPDEER